MSYSRWINSVWYTYWLASESKVRDEQMFDICGFATLSFDEVDELGFDGTIDMLKDRLEEINKRDNPKDKMFVGKGYTDDEWEELKGYIQEWYNDVKDEFDTPSQQYRDGKITLDDAFIEEV